MGGRIVLLPVHEGDHLEAGLLLLELWNRDLVARQDLALRQIQVAEAGDADCTAAHAILAIDALTTLG